MLTPTQEKGEQAEQLAKDILEDMGFHVENINEINKNNPLYDMVALKNGLKIKVSVKSCWNKNRHLRLGNRHKVEEFANENNAVVLAFLPPERGEEIDLANGRYVSWIIPSYVLWEALEAHDVYVKARPKNAAHSVMVKDKIDTVPHSKSGKVFQEWKRRFENNWGELLRMVP